MSAPSPVSRRVIALYGLPAAGFGFMQNLIGFYLLKYATDELGLSPAWMGLAFVLARLWDAVSDPIVGYWSDRSTSRLGRRRTFLAASAIPAALAFLALWAPPRGLDEAALTVWMMLSILLFYSAQTLFQVPHLAWGAELAENAHDRSRIFAGRLAWSLSGVLLSAAALGALENRDGPREVAHSIALAGGLAVVLAVGLSTARLREAASGPRALRVRPFAAFGQVLRNRQARVLLGVLFLEALGFASMTASLPYANAYLMDMEGMTGALLGGAMIVMLVGIPVWLALARRYGKGRVWLFSLAARALSFAGLSLVAPGQTVLVFAGVVVIGASFGCGSMLGPSVQADVIEYDARASGTRKEGTFFAAWNLAEKAATGFALGLSGLVLSASGFVPHAEQGASALLGIRALFAILPCAFYALAALLLARLGEAEAS